MPHALSTTPSGRVALEKTTCRLPSEGLTATRRPWRRTGCRHHPQSSPWRRNASISPAAHRRRRASMTCGSVFMSATLPYGCVVFNAPETMFSQVTNGAGLQRTTTHCSGRHRTAEFFLRFFLISAIRVRRALRTFGPRGPHPGPGNSYRATRRPPAGGGRTRSDDDPGSRDGTMRDGVVRSLSTGSSITCVALYE